MILTITGIALVVLKRENQPKLETTRKKFRFNYPIWGILLGLGGALGQAVGLVLSKFAMNGYNAFASSQIRILAGITGFLAVFLFTGKWGNISRAFSDKKALSQLSLGAFFGPFLGVSFSLLSVQLTSTGIAATIMALVPVLIIPPSVILFGEKVTLKEVAGALLAVGGVALFFI